MEVNTRAASTSSCVSAAASARTCIEDVTAASARRCMEDSAGSYCAYCMEVKVWAASVSAALAAIRREVRTFGGGGGEEGGGEEGGEAPVTRARPLRSGFIIMLD